MPTSSITEATPLSLSTSSEAWEKVVSFPSDPSQENNCLGNLIVATMPTSKSAGPDRKSINFGLYCFPADSSSNVPLMTPLHLILEDDRLLVTTLHTSWLPWHPLFPCRATPDRERCTRLLYHEVTLMNRSNDLYQRVTDEIIAVLEKGVIPRVRPWREGEPVVPMNALSEWLYHGINIPLLWNSAERQGHENDRWLTFTQIYSAGGNIRRGEKSTLAVLYLPQRREVVNSNGSTVLDADGNPKLTSYATVREFWLSNIQQCEELPEAFSQPVVMVNDPIAAAEQVAQQNVVVISHRCQNRTYYSPGRDCIIMPHPEQFISREDYYGTLLHELTHATGHASRPNRDGITAEKHAFGDPTYSFEELVAEMRAASLCVHVGIQSKLQHESYIASWLKVLQQDKKAIFRASGLAHNACEYLLERALQPLALSV